MSAGASVRRALKQLAEGWPIVQERGRRDFGSYVQVSERVLACAVLLHVVTCLVRQHRDD